MKPIRNPARAVAIFIVGKLDTVRISRLSTDLKTPEGMWRVGEHFIKLYVDGVGTYHWLFEVIE